MMTEDLPSRWQGTLVIEGDTPDFATGDGRIIDSGALVWDTPLTLRVVNEDSGAHDGAQRVGLIETIERLDDGRLWGEGPFDLGNEVGREAARQVSEGYLTGVSVDMDDIEFELRDSNNQVPDEQESGGDLMDMLMGDSSELMAYTSGRIRAATLVDIPAFRNATIESVSTTDTAAADVESFEIVGSTELPIANLDRAWNGGAAVDRIFAHFTDEDGNVNTNQVKKAFIWLIPGQDPANQSSYKGPYADIIDGTLTIVPNAVEALAGGHGVNAMEGMSDQEHEQLRQRVCALYDAVRDTYDDFQACPFEDKEEAVADTVTAASYPVAPPSSWFADPDLFGPTGIVVTEQGQVYGHLANWNTCHTAQPGGPGTCVTAPSSPSNYSRFHVGSLRTSDDRTISIGHITMGTRHAPEKASPSEAALHYEHSGTTVADVRAGEDAYGIWVAGALRPSLTDEQVRALRASPLSGDWRRVDGALELHAALAVNVPGFPVPRPSGMVASGELTSLVASGMVAPSRVRRSNNSGDLLSDTDLAYLKKLADRERANHRADLAARVQASRMGV